MKFGRREPQFIAHHHHFVTINSFFPTALLYNSFDTLTF
jgi:hypothetical protein